MDKDEKYFQQSAYELIITERDYVADLNLLYYVFCQPMLDQNILKPDEISKLYSNLEEIITVNQRFLSDLENCVEDVQDFNLNSQSKKLDNFSFIKGVGRAILASVAGFECYEKYCCNHSSAIAFLDAKMKSEFFKNCLQELEMREECKGLKISSFLIKPIQRICKYPLLIKEMLKNKEAKNEAESMDLKAALKEMELMVHQINLRKYQYEQAQIITATFSKIKFEESIEVRDDERLVYEGEFTEIVDGRNSGDRYLFLLSSMVIITKPINIGLIKEKYKAIHCFSLNHISVNNVFDSNQICQEDQMEIAKQANRYQKKISVILQAPLQQILKWISEFEKLNVKRNVDNQLFHSINSPQEAKLFQTLFQRLEGPTVDPMEQYRREQEENYRKNSKSSLIVGNPTITTITTAKSLHAVTGLPPPVPPKILRKVPPPVAPKGSLSQKPLAKSLSTSSISNHQNDAQIEKIRSDDFLIQKDVKSL